MSAPLPIQTKFALVPGEQLLVKKGCALQPNPEAVAWWRGTLYVTNLRVVYCNHSWFGRIFLGNLIFLFSAKKVYAQIDPAHIRSATVENYVLAKKVVIVADPGGWVAFPGMNAEGANQVVAAIGQVHNMPRA